MKTKPGITSAIFIAAILLHGCATTPEYLPAPSSSKPASEYHREQLNSPTSKQVGGAAASGAIGGLLGPLGIIVAVVGANSTRISALETYWKSIDDTELVGVVIEDATQKRNAQFLDNPRWFSNLPNKDQLPQQMNIDFGSGNSLVFPVNPGIHPAVGDVVTVVASPTAHKLMKPRADFYHDLPWIVGVRCNKQDVACIADPANEPGVARRGGIVQVNMNADASSRQEH